MRVDFQDQNINEKVKLGEVKGRGDPFRALSQIDW